MKTTKPENFRKWLDALRSGEYKQGQNALHKGDTYCCLGVASDLCGLGDWQPPVFREATEGLDYAIGSRFHHGYLLPEVIEWLGIEGENIEGEHGFSVPIGETAAHIMNDRGDSYMKIADALEKEYL